MTIKNTLTDWIVNSAKELLLEKGEVTPLVIVRYHNSEIIINASEFMESNETKRDLSCFIHFLVLELEDVSSVSLLTEGWFLSSEDHENIEAEHKRYGNIADHPLRKECILVVTDDGQQEYTHQIPFERQTDSGLPFFAEEPHVHSTPIGPNHKDPEHIFNGLLTKGRSLINAMGIAMSMTSEETPSRYKAKQEVVDSLCMIVGNSKPKKAFKLARQFAKDINKSNAIKKQPATQQTIPEFFQMPRNVVWH